MNNELRIIDTEYGVGHGDLRSYVTGFVMSILLTLLPYFIVVKHLLSGYMLVAAIVCFGVAQLLVQLVFFLHLSPKAKAKWNLIALVFTGLIVLILVVGTLWIMNNLNYNMSQTIIDKNSKVDTAF